MPIEPYSARHTTEDLGDTLRISIPSKKQWLLILFVGFWLVGWAFGEYTALNSLVGGLGFGGPSLFMLAWLGMWTVGGALVIFVLAWQLFGREVIKVSSQAIVTDRVVLGFGRPKEYSAQHIKSLRLSAAVNANDMYGWSRAEQLYGLTGGRVAFDYGFKTIHFGIGVDEAEAKQIIAEITQRFPQYREMLNQD